MGKETRVKVVIGICADLWQSEEGPKLFQVIDLDLKELDRGAGLAEVLSSLDGHGDTLRDLGRGESRNVVVLDHDSIVQPDYATSIAARKRMRVLESVKKGGKSKRE